MNRMLWLALAAMLAQQTCVTLGKQIVPVIGPAMTAAIGVEAEMVGLFVATTGIASTVGAVAAGAWIHRFGAMRVSQISLLMVGAGLAATTVGWIPAIALGAMILGFGTVLATPASSEILARYAPPGRSALVFSLKQTGVPAGTMLGGLIGPLFVAWHDWRMAIWVVVGSALLLTMALAPLTARIDSDASAARQGARIGFFDTLARTLSEPQMRDLAFAMGAFVGLQNVFTVFFVTFAVVKLDYSLLVAGQVFAAAQLMAVFARVFWGWAGGAIGGRRLLGLLGMAMAAISVLLGLVTAAWPFLVVAAVAVALAGTAVSWHGVLLSEVARLSPPGMVGAMTGGVIACGSVTSIVYPLLMWGIIAVTDSYALCFWIAAVPPLLIAILLLKRP